MGDKVIEIQHQIKNNASSIRDYLDELGNWEEEINQIDAQLANKTFPLLEPPLPVRASTEDKPNNPQPAVYKRDKNDMKDYYKAWDSYDVDKELENLEDKPSIYKAPRVPAKANSKITVKGGRSVNSDVDRLKDAGNLEFASKNYQKATEKYIACLDLEVPNDIQIILHSNIAECWLRLKENNKALDSASSALNIDPKHIKSLLRRAKAKKALGSYKSARADLEFALQIDEKNAILKQELLKLNKKVEALVTELKEKMVNRGRIPATGLVSVEVQEIGKEVQEPKKEEFNIKVQTEKAIESVAIEKLPIPKTLIEFERNWAMLTDIKKLRVYLESIPEDTIRAIFEKSSLESDSLMRIFNTLLNHFGELQVLAPSIVQAIVSNKKFSIVARFLTKKEKEKIKELLGLLGTPDLVSI